MRVLLDACVPKGLRRSLAGHEVRTAPEMGWGDRDNSELLDAMTGHFDALVTVDKRLPQQQHITGRPQLVGDGGQELVLRLVGRLGLLTGLPLAREQPGAEVAD